ncbi:zinc ABC transporter, periplasmic-binding protein ZnuA [Mycolicibacterium novocastrense]|uniref:Zinc ABC transporter, periplasmic-binding protein ZnuA n=1 Tax=Mycolicibacterium novocastrense TaxID=59813 RepID=A0ABQ0KPB9_MYCNV|nr:zinc ABC transporter, periplasmic-binding protein ZnuA [Mycolicibacterium novocastrense]
MPSSNINVGFWSVGWDAVFLPVAVVAGLTALTLCIRPDIETTAAATNPGSRMCDFIPDSPLRRIISHTHDVADRSSH